MDISILLKLYKNVSTDRSLLGVSDNNFNITAIEEQELTLAVGSATVEIVATNGIIIVTKSTVSLTGDVVKTINKLFVLVVESGGIDIDIGNPNSVETAVRVFTF